MRRKLTGKSNNASSRRCGFTLTEVVVASSILAFAMVPILKGLVNAHMTATIIEKKTKSLSYAQMKLEEVKARSIYNYGSSLSESNTSLGDRYYCNVTDTSVSADLRNINVSTGFDEDADNILDSDEIRVTLQTSLARRW
ncbi:MAG: type II secretion system protein [Planctomycetes bacterium]|nr:type II secretion system protein [Planctomycetota bacterium]